MKKILDKHNIKPIYGIIPDNQDPQLFQYKQTDNFWELMCFWQKEGWIPAMHGCTHVFETKDGGINPVNKKSEFAGLPLNGQRKKIRRGYEILRIHDINPSIFFAPAHTYDENTLKALYMETPVRVISDTIANDVYYKKPFYFIPQQSGAVRRLPFRLVTFCYHPNIMKEKDFIKLDNFLCRFSKSFETFSENILTDRKKQMPDRLLNSLYFLRKRMLQGE